MKKYYSPVLEEELLPKSEEALGDIWTLVNDGASVNRAYYTKDWLQSNDVHVLDSPVK